MEGASPVERGGRLTLIKSNLDSILNYFFSLSPSPPQLLPRLRNEIGILFEMILLMRENFILWIGIQFDI